MTQRISHFLLSLIVISVLNGCFFSQQNDQRWNLEPQGSSSISLSRDGHFALLSSPESHLVLWDLASSKKLAELGPQDPQEHTLSHIRISDNGRFAITASQTNFAVWDLGWTQAKGLWSISDGIILDVDIASDGKQVLLGLSNGKAIYVDLVSGRRMEFLAHREKVTTVALSANGKYALTGGNDYNAYLWDTETGHIIWKFTHKQRVVKVALQRDGKLAFTSDGGNQARIWDLTTGKEKSHLKSWSRQLIFSAARFSDSGDKLITGTPASQVMVWNTTTGKKDAAYQIAPLKDARPPRAVVYDVALDHQGRIITASSAGIIQAWK